MGAAKRIDNPDYKGEWVHPMIANPKFEDDDTMYSFEDFGAIGIDVWQVKSGSIFDNFLITDDQAELDAQFEAFKGIQEADKAPKEAAEAEKKAKEAAEKKAKEEEEKEEEEEEE